MLSEFDTEQSTDLGSAPAKLRTPAGTGQLPSPDNVFLSSPRASGHLPVSTAVESTNNPFEAQGSDKSTTGRMSVLTRRAGPSASGRAPVVIPGAGKPLPQKTGTRPMKTTRRVLLHASVVFILFVFVSTTLAAVLPLGQDGQALGVNGLLQKLGVISQVSSNSNTVLVGAQAATATAIMQQDGYDPGKQVSQQYNASLGINGTGNGFPYGQCTWWAAQRYHDLTGYWVAWSGNAYQWAAGARAAGWMVSGTPHIPSIMVFAPGVQYSSPVYGHVSIAESINPDGSISTSNMNVAGHPFGSVVYQTNYAGAGVQFVWHG